MANQDRERMPQDIEDEDAPRGTGRDTENKTGRARQEGSETGPDSERGRSDTGNRSGSTGGQGRRGTTRTRKK